MLHIIDNKKVDLTDGEWEAYNSICKSYDDGVKQRGRDLFVDLFDVDDNGIIIALRAPKRQTSFEIIFFVTNIFHNQHIRLMHAQIDEACRKVDEALAKINYKNKKK